MAVFIAENKLDSIEEVRLSRTISADDHIVPRVKRLHNSLLAVGLEALNDHLLDEHPGNPAGEAAGSERFPGEFSMYNAANSMENIQMLRYNIIF